MIASDGKLVFASLDGHKPYGSLPVMLGKRPGIAAISSSVGYAREYPLVFAATARLATGEAPLMVFDMGHDQYSG